MKFEAHQLIRIEKNDNHEVDALVKLASSCDNKELG